MPDEKPVSTIDSSRFRDLFLGGVFVDVEDGLELSFQSPSYDRLISFMFADFASLAIESFGTVADATIVAARLGGAEGVRIELRGEGGELLFAGVVAGSVIVCEKSSTPPWQ